ncbi:MAG: hypothetical protein JSS81_14815 [Acidobacteria bacterium]|nr:hypothetical protein [Acidobacteriota bacterium]
MLIRIFAAAALVLAAAAVCLGQAKTPDLGGSWRLVEADGAKIGAKSVFAGVTLKITQSAAAVTIEKTKTRPTAAPVTETFTFYADGRGETNAKTPLEYRPVFRSPVSLPPVYPDQIGSKTVWDDRRLVTRYEKITAFVNKNTVFVTARDEWSLSDDGQKLILKSSAVTEDNDGSIGQAGQSAFNESAGSNVRMTRFVYVFEKSN